MSETTSICIGPFTVGKKKDKVKDKEKDKDKDRPGRKDLARELEALRSENEALRARLERIAEIATTEPEEPEETRAPALLAASGQSAD